MTIGKPHVHRAQGVLAMSMLLAASATAQSTMTPANQSVNASRSTCTVTPVKRTAADTMYTLRSDSITADSTRLVASGATVTCRPAATSRTTRTSGGDVALAPRARASTRIPVSKEPPPPEPVVETPAPAPVPTPEPTPVPVVQDTVVEVPPPAPEVPAPLPIKRYGNGFYIGLGGGSGVPTEAIRNAYDPGLALSGLIGWDSPTGPLGVRLSLGYTRLESRSTFRTTGTSTATAFNTGGTTTIATLDPQIWSAMGDLKLRFPFNGNFAGPTTGLYLVGGAGVNYFRNYNTTFALTNPEFTTTNGTTTVVTTRESLTRFAANGGGGLSLGLGGSTEVFLESRYVSTFTDGRRASYVPIILGLTFR